MLGPVGRQAFRRGGQRWRRQRSDWRQHRPRRSIEIFPVRPGSYYESSYQGSLESVELDATHDRMHFVFMVEAYGPLTFDLQRLGEAPPK